MRCRLAAGLAAGLLLAAARATAAPLPVVEVAAGIYVHRGADEDFSAANRGGIANLAFVVGRQAVAVVDSGGSLGEGQDLLAAIRAVTDLPVRFVVDTHDHPDHVLGNLAFQAPGVVFAGHAGLAAALAERGPAYLANMRQLLGPAAAGAALVPPTLAVPAGQARRLQLGDRELVLQAWPTAHTDVDLTVLDETTGTLLAGDLLFVGRLPVIDGSLSGWLAVMDELARIKARQVVPGHGPASAAWPAALAAQRDYLVTLRDQVRVALQQGLTLQQAVDTIPLPGPEWRLRELNHQRNVTAAYTELEWE